MKKIRKTIASLMMAYVMLAGLTVTAFAAESSITYEGGAENFVFFPGSEYTNTDLFDNFKDVMPGDTLYEEIHVKNEARTCDFVKIYMRAVVHNEDKNPLTYSETFENTDGKDQTDISGQRDENVATMQDFLSQLSMTIWNGDTLIYKASPDELDGLRENVLLGEFEKGESTELTIKLSVPMELGNEYANRAGEVDWVFVAEEIMKPTPETGDSVSLFTWYFALTVAAVTILIVKKRVGAKNV